MMVYHKINPNMKQRVLQLIDEGWEMQDVTDILGVASKSIRQWADNYDTHRCIRVGGVQQIEFCFFGYGHSEFSIDDNLILYKEFKS